VICQSGGTRETVVEVLFRVSRTGLEGVCVSSGISRRFSPPARKREGRWRHAALGPCGERTIDSESTTTPTTSLTTKLPTKSSTRRNNPCVRLYLTDSETVYFVRCASEVWFV
jgi:hypothetical protein